MQYNRIRTLLPYLIALTASSPLVEGHLTGNMDNRSIYYRRNQDVIPQICNGIIPARIRSIADTGMRRSRSSRRSGRGTQGSSARNGSIQAGSLSGSRGSCLEIKAPDEQECIRSDMAVAALVTALLRCPTLPVESDQEALLALTEVAIEKGTAASGRNLRRSTAVHGRRRPLKSASTSPVIESRIANGSLAEQITERFRSENAIGPILADMAHCLRANQPYGMK